MSDFWLAGCFPRRWCWDPPPSFFSEIIVNWLEIEVDQKAVLRMEILQQVHGHRRREIVGWLNDTKELRSIKTANSIYGYPGACL